MKKSRIFALGAVAALTLSLANNASAQQTLRSGYFLDGYNYRYKLNPAIGNDLNFISIPVIGNLNVGTTSNVSLSTFLFPRPDGTLDSFLSPNVKADEFLSGIKDKSLLGAELSETIFALGFHTGKTYHTIDISTRANASLNVPGDLFRFIKAGKEKATFDDFGMKADAFVEIAYGFSTDISDRFRIGARIKALGGVGYVDTKINHGSFVDTGDLWRGNAQGSLEGGGYLLFKQIEDGKELNIIPEFSENIVAQSLGGAIDLGVTAKINDHLKVSLAALDLGAIMWNNVTNAETPSTEWEFDGFDDDEKEASFDELIDKLSECFILYQKNTEATKGRFLNPTLSAGVEFIIPSYENISLGALLTRKFDGPYSWNEARASVNYAPSRWFSCNVTAAESTFGFSTGAMINLHSKGINFYLGTDNLLPWTKTNSMGIPIESLTANLTMGLNITFGRYIGRFPKVEKIKSMGLVGE